MATSATTWTVILRCYTCREKFTLRRLTRDRVLVVPLITPCPHCSAQPHMAYNNREESKLHRMIDLREEAQSAYRKINDGDAWHFNTQCSKWPTADYIELEILPSVGGLCDECKAKHSIANPIRPLAIHEPLANGS